ncbi:hypothetical protein QRX50_48220 [Amycolatopsis carbonis]|uniref:Uncharacterized protein n=1 Tax=Amycolatopsis carbonis TaxID=715471 RepID=A0A9Y2MXN9_9PSEU|nr:hypothetical protein [Amycolatopsis sp. 2-15]WIX79032.1 hypothetical protein QRX50_48220 [Amycolatopsis sp. 2-15]
MTSRSRAVVAALLAVFALGLTAASVVSAPEQAYAACVRPCHF